MKRALCLLAALTLAGVLAACGSPSAPAPAETTPSETPPAQTEPAVSSAAELLVKVMAVYEDHLLVAAATPEAKTGELYTLPRNTTVLTDVGEPHTGLVIEPGAVLRVCWDGTVLETYPARFGSIDAIRFVRQEDSLISLYLLVIDDLYTEDPGLNDRIDTLAFNLTQVPNLSAAEKSALTYIAGEKYGLGTMEATYQDLVQMGLIEDDFYFKTGLLFTIEVTDPGTDSFAFSASKWRSGLGAIGMNDCKASLEKGLWRYTPGDQWIS